MTRDVVLAEVLRSRLAAMNRELRHLLINSAFSTLMREARDCSVTLTGPAGERLAQSMGTGFFVRRILERFTPEQGDVFLSNHPYEAGVQHTPDLLIGMPVIDDGALVGFCVSSGHKADTGGAVVGSVSSFATELIQEGLLLPVMRAGNEEVLDANVLAIIEANVRDPELFLGDVRAQLGVTRTGRDRLLGLVRSLGRGAYLRALSVMFDQGERTMRQALSAWPDGTSEAEGYVDDDGVVLGVPVRLHVSVEKRGDAILFDCSGCADQTQGPINRPRALSEATIHSTLLSALAGGRHIAYNEGVVRPITIRFREGTIVAPTFPAPVGASSSVNHLFIDVLQTVLARFDPPRGIAPGGGGSTMAVLHDVGSGTGSRAMQYEIFGSARGASGDRDGCSGILPPAGVFAVTPIEVLEAQFPVRIRRFELIEDSAGPGRFRGGLSYRREYEFLTPVSVNRRATRERFPGGGLFGGGHGQTARQFVTGADGTCQALSSSGQFRFEPGDRLLIESAGGGGYGDPLERDLELVATDVRRGYVSVQAALEQYGVVVTGDGAVDVVASERVRAERRSSPA